MRQGTFVSSDKDNSAVYRLIKYWYENTGWHPDRSSVVHICENVKARWFPPYLGILPKSVLSNILGRLDMKAAISCFSTCRKLRATMLKVLRWKPVDSLALQISVCRYSIGVDDLLPEVLIHLFGFMGTYTLQACAKTCKTWRKIIQDNPRVLAANVELGSDPWSAEEQWTRLVQLAKGSPVTSLSMDRWRGFVDEEDYHLKRNFTLLKESPAARLQYFSYNASYASDADENFWKKLLNCTQLKVIRFKVPSGVYGGCSVKIPHDSKLAKCRLEELVLSCAEMNVSLDKTMLGMLREAKRISMDFVISNHDVRRLLAVAETTVQELRFGKVVEADYSLYQEEESYDEDDESIKERLDDAVQEKPLPSTFAMTALTSFAGHLPQGCTMETPLLEQLELHVAQPSDFNILRTSRQHLRVLSCHFLDPSTSRAECMEWLIANIDYIPNCHTISIHLGCCKGHSRDVWSDTREDSYQFWRAFLCNSGSSLMNLRHLTISDNGSGFTLELTAEMLLGLLHSSKDAGVPLTSLHLVNIAHFDVESLIKLRQSVPQFSYSTVRVPEDCSNRRSEGDDFEMYPPKPPIFYPVPQGVVQL